ncbi:methyltransferase [Aureimonas sp. ME7]|uniref:tRNA1(Val) (adenine(37)-N6)-methyltransferase n=1 Tax=Aureimonas sp. ME7 TaxID=2744252 RepID=UPI0015F670FF|nr:methyltransferase [Aureimonas sp. ME7]
MAGEDFSRDAFFAGRFHLLQPRRAGLRSGHDALLLASTVAPERKGRAVDLGSGAGAVALAAAVRAPGLQVVMAERDERMATLAEATLLLPENAPWTARLQLARLDVTAQRPVREAAGLCDGAFDLVLTNPPFHPSSGRRSPDPLRDAAKVAPDADFVDRWLRVSAALLRQGGELVMIGRPDQLGEILSAAMGRFGDLRIRPVHSHSDAPAVRLLVSARRGSRAPLRLLPMLLLDEATNQALGEGALRITMD